MIRAGNYNRAKVVSSCPGGPTPVLSTSVPREAYEAIERMAKQQKLSKAAYLRKIVLEHVENGWANR